MLIFAFIMRAKFNFKLTKRNREGLVYIFIIYCKNYQQ